MGDTGSENTQRAARLALEALAPLCGLNVDATRVASLQPLVTDLLLQGEQLTRSIEPTVEPFFLGDDVRRIASPT